MRILVTGSRAWTDTATITLALLEAASSAWLASDVTVIHGGARGADSAADGIARSLGYSTELHRADWKQHGRRAGIVRNLAMIRAGADVCLAFIVSDSPGATHCARAAEQAGIPVRRYSA